MIFSRLRIISEAISLDLNEYLIFFEHARFINYTYQGCGLWHEDPRFLLY